MLDLARKTALPKRPTRIALDLEEIKAIIDLMKTNDLSVFEMEEEGFKIKLQRGANGQPVVAAPIAIAPASGIVPIGQTSPEQSAAAAAALAKKEGAMPLKDIVSPMVGTFFRAASPDSSPFAEVGKEVTEETVVCIIEAMKVMNEIKAEISGVIAEVVAENGKPVQFGQTLFRVR